MIIGDADPGLTRTRDSRGPDSNETASRAANANPAENAQAGATQLNVLWNNQCAALADID